MIYADGPLLPEVPLADGRIWKNLVTPGEVEGGRDAGRVPRQLRYNLLDEHMRRFNAAVPMLAQWDDHEVMNNWHPGDDPGGRPAIHREEHRAARRTREAGDVRVRAVPLGIPTKPSASTARSAYGPRLEVFLLDERSYRGPNGTNRAGGHRAARRAMLGRAQLDWLKARLLASPATWKVIATDMPLGLIVRRWRARRPAGVRGLGQRRRTGARARAGARGAPVVHQDRTAFATSSGSPPTSTTRRRTTTTRHGAVTKDFLPFWEFVAGPLHAGNFGPNAIDPTFGPEVKYQSAQPGGPQNRPPSEGYQYFGTLTIDGGSGRLSAELFDVAGERLYGVDLGSVGSGGRHVARRRAARCQLHAERCLGDEHAPRTERDDLQPDGT